MNKRSAEGFRIASKPRHGRVVSEMAFADVSQQWLYCVVVSCRRVVGLPETHEPFAIRKDSRRRGSTAFLNLGRGSRDARHCGHALRVGLHHFVGGREESVVLRAPEVSAG